MTRAPSIVTLVTHNQSADQGHRRARALLLHRRGRHAGSTGRAALVGGQRQA